MSIGTAVVRACAVGLLTLPVSGDVSAQTATPTYTPAANVCVLCDLGVPAGGPIWLKEIGLFAKGSDGSFYSTSTSGGKNNNNSGTIFKVSPKDGVLEVLYDFNLVSHGANPRSGLIDGGYHDDKGKWVYGPLYGTTYTGGTYKANNTGATRTGAGTVFRFEIGKKAPEVLHTFRNGDLAGIPPEICEAKKPCQYSPQQRLNAAASYPTSAPVRASDGSFYGVTSYANNQDYGVLYKVQPYKGESGITALCINGDVPGDPATTDIRLRELCMFNGANGNHPVGLVADIKRNLLWGVTVGGSPKNPSGTLFQATLSGRVETKHRFEVATGSRPYSLLLGSDGALYGTTVDGGKVDGAPGAGVVYKMTPDGQYTVLYTFKGGADGSQPISGLVELKSANGKTYLYGAARYGGQGRGVLYRVSTTGEFEALHQHPQLWTATGRTPSTTLFEMDGLFYGTTYQGGTNDAGVIFRMSGVDLPQVRNLSAPPAFSTGKAGPSMKVPLPGQAPPVLIEVYTGVTASQQDTQRLDDAIKIRVSNCRNPHILQFIYREKLGVDGVALGGRFQTSLGQAYDFTTNPDAPVWHTDAGVGTTNAFYDQANGTPRIVNPFGLTMADEPTFQDDPKLKTFNFPAQAHETWRATFKSYVICNCQVVREIRWMREVPWVVDLSGSPTVVPNQNRGKQGPARYGVVSIVEPSGLKPRTPFEWAEINKQIEGDGYTAPYLPPPDKRKPS